MLQATLLIFYGAVLQAVLSSGRYDMPFGCRGMTGTDQTRQQALNLINRIRSSVALGDFKAQNFLPSASNMRKLAWDCNLEAVAQRAVRNCPRTVLPARGVNGRNYQYFGPGTPASILRSPIQYAVLQWIGIESTRWPANNVFNGDPVLRNFANLIRAGTAAVGCSTAKCGNQVSAACVFSQPNVRIGTLVYTSGNACRTDMECSAFSPAFCESGLCVNSARPSTTASPRTTTIP